MTSGRTLPPKNLSSPTYNRTFFVRQTEAGDGESSSRHRSSIMYPNPKFGHDFGIFPSVPREGRKGTSVDTTERPLRCQGLGGPTLRLGGREAVPVAVLKVETVARGTFYVFILNLTL